MSSEQERAEIHKTIWAAANELRGAVDGWDFKQYMLGFLFYRFISENLVDYINKNEREEGNANFDYTELSDEQAEYGRKTTTDEKGFYILPSELFSNVLKRASNDPNLNETISRVLNNIEASAMGTPSEKDVKGLFDDIDLNSNRLGPIVVERNSKIVKIMNVIANLRMGDYRENKIDAFGDAYEFLMTMYASSAGKSGGEFFTPQEVSELLAKLAIDGRQSIGSVYDPACGSGSLLLKFAKILGKDHVDKFYGQEINLTTYNLARYNMFLHDINYTKFDIAHDDTLIHPQHLDDAPFDAIVSNPPYSIKWAGNDSTDLINDPRFSPAGVLAPKSYADLAFTMHMLYQLSAAGTAAIVEFPGVLYRGGAEQKIRRYLVDNNYIDTVIQLPDNLFFGTSIATCILTLKKSKNDNSILFVDASNQFIHEGNKNKLSEDNISHILELVKNRKDVDYEAKLADSNDIKSNDYNLAVGSYVDKEDTREKVDIDELNRQIAQVVARENELRQQIDDIVREIEG